VVLAGVPAEFLSLLAHGSPLRGFAYDPRPGASVARAIESGRA
jgi:hypothetical protein